jgi:hypothetical protein
MVCVGEKRVAYRALVRKPEGENHSEHLCVERSIILEWIFNKQDGTRNRLICLMIGASDGLL